MTLAHGTKVRISSDPEMGDEAGEIGVIEARVDWVTDRETYRLVGREGHYNPEWLTVIEDDFPESQLVLVNLREAVKAARKAGYYVDCKVSKQFNF